MSVIPAAGNVRRVRGIHLPAYDGGKIIQWYDGTDWQSAACKQHWSRGKGAQGRRRATSDSGGGWLTFSVAMDSDCERRAYVDRTFERLEMRSSSRMRGVMFVNSSMHKPCLTAETFRPIRVPRPELSI